MTITVLAPTRIDLAGGTTDIYPLYLFMEGGCTVNAAITVQSRVSVSPRDDARVKIISEDLQESLDAATVEELPVSGCLGLLARAIRALPPPKGLEMRTHNQAPAGSGLGSSSALLVAAVAALMQLRGEETDRKRIVDIAANIETAAIGVPAGKQDHIAAAYGGLSVIEFGYRDFVRQSFSNHTERIQYLQDTVILTYTGLGRFSGKNNWEVTRAFIDGEKTVQDRLIRIRDVARDMCRALKEGNWDELSGLMNLEWSLRRTLAPGVSTPQVDAIMADAVKAGASAGKICGAGGGGCMVTLTRPKKRSAVERALVDGGAELMPFTFDFRGVGIRES